MAFRPDTLVELRSISQSLSKIMDSYKVHSDEYIKLLIAWEKVDNLIPLNLPGEENIS